MDGLEGTPLYLAIAFALLGLAARLLQHARAALGREQQQPVSLANYLNSGWRGETALSR